VSITAGDVTSFGIGLVELLVFVGYVAGLWKLLNVVTPSVDDHHEIFVGGNWAYLVQRLGIALAQAIGMFSSIGVSQPNRWSDVGWLALAGLWVSVLLLAVRPVVDRTVERSAQRADQAHADNLAVSMVKAAFFVAFGFVVNGSLTGSAPNLATALTATAVFTVLGGAVLLACYRLHDLVHPQAVHDGVRAGRLPASVEAAGVLVALGLIMRNAIAGDFVGWAPALIGFGVTAVAGLVVLYVARWLIDRLVITSFTLKEIHESNQVTAAALLAALLPLVAMPVTAVVGTLV
jgi:hypothetical protein